MGLAQTCHRKVAQRTSVLQPRPSGACKHTPARRISLKGNRVGIGRAWPLRKTTSAAYGVSRDSIANGAAVDCPVSTFFATSSWLGGLPGEENRTPHVPSEVFGALVFRRGRCRRSILRAPKPLKRCVPCFEFFLGSPPDSRPASGKIELGNTRGARRRQNLGQGCRPSRSFLGGATLSRFQKSSPSGKCTERGRSVVAASSVTTMRPRRPGMASRDSVSDSLSNP